MGGCVYGQIQLTEYRVNIVVVDRVIEIGQVWPTSNRLQTLWKFADLRG